MLHLFLSFIFMIVLPGSLSVTIQRMIVPKWVQNGTEDAVTLDCEYKYTENDFKLVVKWFFNNNDEPVYQWIPEVNTREAFGILQNRLDLEFSVNARDDYSQYRAIRILRPTVELSGKYTCLVSSLAGQDSRDQEMTVYVPPQSFDFNYTISGRNSAKLRCVGKGVFPAPELKLFLVQPDGKTRPLTGVRTVTFPRNNLFDVVLDKDIHENELPYYTNIVECVLEIPFSTYSQRKKLALSQGLAWGSQSLSGSSTPFGLWVTFITVMVCISSHVLLHTV